MKRAFSLIALLFVVIAALASCTIGGSGGGNEGGGGEVSAAPEGHSYVYRDGTPVNIIRNNESLGSSAATDILNSLRLTLQLHTQSNVNIDNDNLELVGHEIVFGATNREVTEQANLKLQRAMVRYARGSEDEEAIIDDLAGYVIYAKGGSVAVYWTHDLVAEKAINYFVDNYVNGDSLLLKDGYCKTEVFEYVDHLRELDSERVETEWAAVEKALGAEATQALKDHYSLYSERFYLWMVDLYDPAIGGFYYSSSARDTVGFLPDIESTAQALAFLNNSGMTKSAGGKWENVIPEDMKKALLNFALSLQSPHDGYFYHPQWSDLKMGASRLARDIGWAVTVIENCGGRPYWDTPSGTSGKYGKPGSNAEIPEGWEPSQDFGGSTALLPDAPAAALCSSLYRTSRAVAVSKVVSTAVSEGWTPQLQTYENWVEYVDSFDLLTNSYSAGNTLASQAAQIRKRDREDGKGGRFAKYLREKMDGGVFAHNGLWQEETTYNAVNGLMKISGLYSSMGWELKYSDKALMSAITMALWEGPDTANKQPTGSVDVYNPWVCISNIKSDARKFHDAAYLGRLQDTIDLYTVELIRATTAKTAKFEKDDGAFGYTWGVPPLTSQGAPVSVAGVVEGDVNGGCIAVTGVTSNMCNGLDIPKPSIFQDADLYVYLKRLNELQGVIKKEDAASEPAFIDFEEDNIGDHEPAGVFDYAMNTGGIQVVERPEATSDNEKALRFDALAKGQGDTVRFEAGGVMAARASSFILEFDMLVDSAKANGFSMQIKMDDSYCLTLVGSGKNVKIADLSNTSGGFTTDFGLTFPMDEWHTVRVEYYYAELGKDVKIKIFLDGVLRFVSSNYYGPKPGKDAVPQKKYSRASFYSLYNSICTFYLDDITLERSVKQYVEEPVVNPDRIKDFERAKHPTDLPSGATLSSGAGFEIIDEEGAENPNKVLHVNSSAPTLTVSAVSSSKPNIYSATMDLYAASMANGKNGYAATLNLKNAAGSLVSYALVASEGEDGEVLLVKPLDSSGKMGETVATLPVGEWVNIGVRFYNDYTYYEKGADGMFDKSKTTVVSEFYVGGVKCATTSVYSNFAALTGGFTSVTFVCAAEAEYYADNITVEAIVGELLDENGEPVPKPEVEIPTGGEGSNVEPDENYNGIIDFESSEIGVPAIPGLQTVPNPKEYRNEITVENAPEIEDGVPNKALMMYATRSTTNGNHFNIDLYDAFGKDAASYVFEMDINVAEVRQASSPIMRIKLGDSYCIYIEYSSATGLFSLKDVSNTSGAVESNSFGVSFGKGAWHRIRVEYYPGTAETVRIKTYLDGKLVYISDNYFGPTTSNPSVAPENAPKNTSLYSYYGPSHTTWFDNLKFYSSDTQFVDEPLHEVKYPDVYDFENTVGSSLGQLDGVSAALSDKAGDDKVVIVSDPTKENNRVLKIDSNYVSDEVNSAGVAASFTLSDTVAVGFNAYVFDLDLNLEDLRSGNYIQLFLGDSAVNKYVFGITIYANEKVDGERVSQIRLNRLGTASSLIGTVAADEDLWYNIRIEYFHAAEYARIYVNGQLVGSSTNLYSATSSSVEIKDGRVFATKTTNGALLVDNVSVKRELVEIDMGKYDFEDQELGATEIEGATLTPAPLDTENNKLYVSADPENAENKALRIDCAVIADTSASGNSVKFAESPIYEKGANCFVFEFDLNLSERKGGYLQLGIHSSEGKIFSTTWYVDAAGLRIQEHNGRGVTSNNIATAVPYSGWTTIRLEYYKEECCLQVYVDGVYYGTSYNYFKDSYKNGTPSTGLFYVNRQGAGTYYVDNVKVEKVVKELDTTQKAPADYDFNGLPEGDLAANGTTATVRDPESGSSLRVEAVADGSSDKQLVIKAVSSEGGGSLVSFKQRYFPAGMNAVGFTFDLSVSEIGEDDGIVLYLSSTSEPSGAVVATEAVFSTVGETLTVTFYEYTAGGRGAALTDPINADGGITVSLEYFVASAFGKLYVNDSWQNDILAVYTEANKSLSAAYGIIEMPATTDASATVDQVFVQSLSRAEKLGDPESIVLGGERGKGVYYKKGVTEGYGVASGLAKDLANIIARGTTATDSYASGKPNLGIASIDRNKALHFYKDSTVGNVGGGVTVLLPEGTEASKYYVFETDFMGFVTAEDIAEGGHWLRWIYNDATGKEIPANENDAKNANVDYWFQSLMNVNSAGFGWGNATVTYGYWHNLVLVFDVEAATVIGYLDGKPVSRIGGVNITDVAIGGITLAARGSTFNGVDIYLDNTCFLATSELESIEKGIEIEAQGAKGTGAYYNRYGGADFSQPSGLVADSPIVITGSNANVTVEGSDPKKLNLLIEKLNGDKVLQLDKATTAAEEGGPRFDYDKTNGGNIFVFEADMMIVKGANAVFPGGDWFRFMLVSESGDVSSSSFQRLINMNSSKLSLNGSEKSWSGVYSTWYNYRAVYDQTAGTFSLYIDGELIDVMTVNASVNSQAMKSIRFHVRKTIQDIDFYIDNVHCASYTELPDLDSAE